MTRTIIRNAVIVIVALLICAQAIYPPETSLRRGRDLAGGVSMIYAVQMSATDDRKEVLEKTIQVIKDRIDPNGLMEIAVVPQGQDRIEITMPLPSDKVKDLRKAFEDRLIELGKTSLTATTLDRTMALPADQRVAEIKSLSTLNPKRTELLNAAAASYDDSKAKRAQYDATTDVAAKEALAGDVAKAEIEYAKAREEVLKTVLPVTEVRKAFNLSNSGRSLEDEKGEKILIDSPREQTLKKLKEQYPGAAAQLDEVIVLYNAYAAERKTLDDPSDLIRMLKGAGVLSFRIGCQPGDHPEEARLRQEFREKGPTGVRSTDAKWCKINQIQNWYKSVRGGQDLQKDAAGFFSAYHRLVGEERNGEYYVLCWDARNSRLTPAEGDWMVAKAAQGTDRYGRPNITFQMDPRGARLLGGMTRDHIHKPMAVLLDDQVYTAPNLNDAISQSGEIFGEFTLEEITYIVRVLSAGSLQAKLSPEPLSIDSIGPQLGQDNLRQGLTAGVISLVAVAGFMVVYYFGSGVIAVVALLVNFLLILGAMAMSKAAFTMPGIAGIVLTFGQAVDSNVLVYERMREEMQRGADLRTAIRLGFSRALSPIMDGNISNLIICLVLYNFGTQEIRGFAITLGIGVVTTLFTATIVTRMIFNMGLEFFGWRHTSQLPMAFPALQRMLTPHIDWMKYRNVLLGGLVVFLLASGAFVFERGAKMLGTEFRGGTEVELQFKTDEKSGKVVTLARQQVRDRLVELSKVGDLRVLADAEVFPINPQADGVTSDRFRIRTAPADEKVILAAITRRFDDVTESRAPLSFIGAGDKEANARVFPILTRSISDNLDRPLLAGDAGAFVGGGAIVIANIEPAPKREVLLARLEQTRKLPDYAGTLGRTSELRVIEGTDEAVKTAVFLVRDDSISALDNPDRWKVEVAAEEWRLVNDALTRSTQLASVRSFSPMIAATFTAHAVMTVVISLLLLTIYVWVRFGTARWAIAATVPLFADVIGIAGMIGLCEILYNNPTTSGFARAIGLLPFKFDLAQIAALLTIIGYSLNDKIIILDRIRENKGKLRYASYSCVNDSINQTLSRTLVTAGSHLITTVILYMYGGEGVRGFAFTFNIGVFLGTYTSIVSSPLVWSAKADKEAALVPGGVMPSAA
jgi:SecD/SecF fusion protein